MMMQHTNPLTHFQPSPAPIISLQYIIDCLFEHFSRYHVSMLLCTFILYYQRSFALTIMVRLLASLVESNQHIYWTCLRIKMTKMRISINQPLFIEATQFLTQSISSISFKYMLQSVDRQLALGIQQMVYEVRVFKDNCRNDGMGKDQAIQLLLKRVFGCKRAIEIKPKLSDAAEAVKVLRQCLVEKYRNQKTATEAAKKLAAQIRKMNDLMQAGSGQEEQLAKQSVVKPQKVQKQQKAISPQKGENPFNQQLTTSLNKLIAQSLQQIQQYRLRGRLSRFVMRRQQLENPYKREVILEVESQDKQPAYSSAQRKEQQYESWI